MCAEITLARMRDLDATVVIYVDPPEAVARTRAWLGADWAVRPQRGATLGQRLEEAFGVAFTEGAQHVLAVGTDSPWIHARDLEGAFVALEQAEVVLGPSEDGGYYVIGLSRALPALFRHVAWGSSSVYAHTLEQARALGLVIQILPQGYDVDRPADLRRFIEEARGRGEASPAIAWMDAMSERRP